MYHLQELLGRGKGSNLGKLHLVGKTQQGAVTGTTVLNSEVAVKASILVVGVFVPTRQIKESS